jgi:hypothetical protein
MAADTACSTMIQTWALAHERRKSSIEEMESIAIWNLSKFRAVISIKYLKQNNRQPALQCSKKVTKAERKTFWEPCYILYKYITICLAAKAEHLTKPTRRRSSSTLICHHWIPYTFSEDNIKDGIRGSARPRRGFNCPERWRKFLPFQSHNELTLPSRNMHVPPSQTWKKPTNWCFSTQLFELLQLFMCWWQAVAIVISHFRCGPKATYFWKYVNISICIENLNHFACSTNSEPD